MKVFFKIFKRSLLALSLLLLLLIVLLQFAGVQKWLANKARENLLEGTQLEQIKFEKLRIGITGKLEIRDLYVPDSRADTLLSLGKIKVRISLAGLLKNKIHLKHISLNNVQGQLLKYNNLTSNIDHFSELSRNGSTNQEQSGNKPEIIIGHIDLEDITFHLTDSVKKFYLNVHLGDLETNLRYSNISALEFDLRNAKLSNADVQINTGPDKPPRIRKEKKAEKKPVIIVNSFNFKDLRFNLNNDDRNNSIKASLEKFKGDPIIVDIGKELVHVSDLNLKRGGVELISAPGNDIDNGSDSLTLLTNVSQKQLSFSGGWQIDVEKIESKNLYAKLLFSEPDSSGYFNPGNMDYADADFSISEVHIRQDSILAHIESFSVTDANEFRIKRLKGTYLLTQNFSGIKDMILETRTSKLSLTCEINVPLTNNSFYPTLINIYNADLSGEIAADEVMYFMPEIPLLNHLSEDNIKIDLKVTGNELKTELDRFRTVVSDKISINAKANMIKDPETDHFKIGLRIDTSYFNPVIIPDSLIPGLIHLNGIISFNGSANFYKDSLDINGTLNGEPGTLISRIHVRKEGENINTESDINMIGFDLEKLIQDSTFGRLDADTRIKISSIKTDSVKDLAFFMIIDSFEVRDQILYDVEVKGEYHDGQFDLISESTNEILKYQLKAVGNYFRGNLSLNYDVNFFDTRSNLFTEKEWDYLFDSKAEGSFQIDELSQYKFISKIKSTSISSHEEKWTYNIPEIELNFQKELETQQLKIFSQGIDIDISGTLPPSDMIGRFKKHAWDILYSGQYSDSASDDQFRVFCKIKQSPVIENLNHTTLLDSVNIDSVYLYYDYRKKELDLTAHIPVLDYSALGVADVSIDANWNKKNTHSDIDIGRLLFRDYSSGRVSLYSNSQVNGLSSRLSIHDHEDRPIISLPFRTLVTDSILRIAFIDDSLLLGYEQWQVNEYASLVYDQSEKNWELNQISFSRDHKELKFESRGDVFSIFVQEANLANYNGFIQLSDSTFLTNGLLSGKLNFVLNDEKWLLNCKARVEAIELFNKPYGRLDLELEQVGPEQLLADVNLVNKKDFIYFSGAFGKNSSRQEDIEFRIEEFNEYAFLNLSKSLEILKGGANGKLSGKYINNSPKFVGWINFNDAQVKILPTGSVFRLENEKVLIDTLGLEFNKLAINDISGNELIIDGRINTTDLKALDFDLKFLADYFMVFNNTKEENEDLFGKLVLSTNAKLKGTLDDLRIESRINIHAQTDFTLVLPGQDLAVNNGEGVIRFETTTKNAVDSVFVSESLERITDSVSRVLGVDYLDLLLLFNKEARYTVITNPQSGDFARFGLTGALAYKYAPNTSDEVSGNIKIIDGLYKISFYDMVEKEFILDPQSTVYFSGPMSNATVDIIAKNIVTTNSIALVSSESPYMSENEKALYSQRLPYEVIFKMNGFLLNPDISFGLDLPDSYKLNSPMIASKLTKLESSDFEQERNMQVFALLVTGGFIAENTAVSSTGSSTVAAATARNTVNGILAQQLNNITSQHITNFDVNLGFNTYEDITRGAGHLTTDMDIQVSKKLMDDRLEVEVESRINLDNSPSSTQKGRSAYNTDFNLFYRIDSSGTYKAKAFNLQLYDLFDGEISNAGMGFMFTKDFDSKKMKEFNRIADSLNADEQ